MRLHHVLAVTGLGVLTGCSSSASLSDGQPNGNGLLDPPPAGQGIQLHMVSTIAPGQETERCKFFQVPAEGLNVNHSVVRYVPGSHHVLLYRTSLRSIPTETGRGTPLIVDENGVFDCADGAAADWDVRGVIAAAQSPDAKNAGGFPPGVAAKLEPGSVLLINTHYLNASSQPLVAEARLNLYTLADKDVEQEGGFLFFYNPFIRLHPRSPASSRLSCAITRDITLVSAQSHMHKRGTGYAAHLTDPSSGSMNKIYESHHWEDVPIVEWTPGMPLRAGQSIDFTCHYQNTEDRQIAQGATTQDEMCMFLGNYYPRDQEIEGCSPFAPSGGATFIGTGAADGKTTLECLAKNGANDATRAEYYGCVQDSCPAVGTQLTNHLKCEFSQLGEGGGCVSACTTPSPTACSDCLAAACGGQKTALEKASCN